MAGMCQTDLIKKYLILLLRTAGIHLYTSTDYFYEI